MLADPLFTSRFIPRNYGGGAMLETLSKLFRLKPYGSHLIDGMAELWMFLGALNIASIAICDAVAWAYFGYTTAHGVAAYVTAATAGLIVLTLVGSLDAMFIMHDRTRRSREGETDSRLPLLKRIRRDHVAIAARVVLVVLTFTVTAPFLTQLFFARDIEASIEGRNEQTIAARRTQIVSAFDGRIERARSGLAARQRDLEKEIAGRGASGRYGRGPTATAIERDVALLQKQLDQTEAAREREVRSFDGATAQPATLARRYGVDFVREGPDTRARVIAELEQSPSFRATRRTIKAFLVFMFLGLVCLKLFQPESVRIYYSAELQAAHARLRAGIFDHRLDVREQHGAEAMTPLRFADWYENDQHVRDVAERLREQTAVTVERLNAQEEALRVLQDRVRSELARLHDDLSSASKTTESLDEQVSASRHELDDLQARIAEEQQQLDDFRFDDGGDLSLRDQQLLIASRNRTARQLSEHRSAAAKLAATLARLTDRLEANRTYERQLRASLSATGTEAGALSHAIHRARQQNLSDLVREQ